MPTPRCPIDSHSSTPALGARPDFEFAVPTRLSYHRCGSCGLVFADPLPSPAIISSFYVEYTTHGQVVFDNPGVFSRIGRRVTLREFSAAAVGGPDEPLLDYGCGDGSFLTELRNMGYTNLIGYDFDPKASEAARRSGAAIASERDQLAKHGPYATITMNHVIEHVADPAEDLAWLAGMLRPGGRIVIRTPNARSVLAKSFGASWRGWETPRHLNIFTRAAFSALAPRVDDLSLVSIHTSEAMFLGIFHGSLQARRWLHPLAKPFRHGVALLAFATLSIINRFAPVGEELVVAFERRN